MILALDTSPRTQFSLALWRSQTDSRQIHHEITPGATGSGHVESLAPAIADIMESEGIGFGDITRIAVNSGPGSFSGVRAGIATARALAQTTSLPLVGISRMELLAINASRHASPQAGETILVALPAGELLFLQAFSAQEPVESLAPAASLAPSEAAEYCRGFDSLLLVGSGDILGKSCRSAGDIPEPDALLLAEIASLRQPSPNPVIPLYMRPPDAKLPQPPRSVGAAAKIL